jgi:hypothetical protein
MTGHANGLITLDINEADDAHREQVRVQMHEPYRTLLGHFRHEVGHYYWDRLIANSDWLEAFRDLFGDERASYAEALERHYQQGAPLTGSSIASAPTPPCTPGKTGRNLGSLPAHDGRGGHCPGLWHECPGNGFRLPAVSFQHPL